MLQCYESSSDVLGHISV